MYGRVSRHVWTSSQKVDDILEVCVDSRLVSVITDHRITISSQLSLLHLQKLVLIMVIWLCMAH
jgi:hypothetical protein